MSENANLPEVVYHYCNATAFYSILTKRALWLGSVLCMNDYMEQRHLLGKAKRLLKELAEGETGRFVSPLIRYFDRAKLTPFACCLSMEGDLLSQWRAYADDGKGFSIGFRSDDLRQAAARHSHPVAVWSVEYEDARQMELLRVGIDRYVSLATQGQAKVEDILSTLLYAWSLSAGCKHHGFREEREVRVILALAEDATMTSENPTKMQFRVANSQVVSYFTLDLSETAIAEIRLGPKNAARDDDSHLRWFLEENGYGRDRVRIVPSEATYR
jgi:hypothetical protein